MDPQLREQRRKEAEERLKKAEEDRNAIVQRLALHADSLEELLCDVKKGIDEVYYRFYHMSFKVFNYQNDIKRVKQKLLEIGDGKPLNSMFDLILTKGLAPSFNGNTNAHWFEETRPIVEAWNHALYFLEAATNVAHENLETCPQCLSSELGSVLYLYNLR